jgi:redox-sensitive bicupin YhaK (pirin superfamily)
MHGYQIWVALPKEQEDMEPNFQFFDKSEIPSWSQDNLQIKLVAGEAFGKSAPLQGYSPLFMVDILAEKETTLELSQQLKGEVAFVIVEGEITEKDHKVKAGQMLISKTDEQCKICLAKGTRLLLFGGEPLDREHFLLWNFVSSDKDKLKQASKRWVNKDFPKVPADDTYIPIPEVFLRK